jgi:hypothetical protein
MKYIGMIAAVVAMGLFAACEQPKDDDADKPAEAPAAEEGMTEESTSTSPMVSEDAPSEPHMGEPPSPNQPQPVYPDGAPQ